MSSRFRPALSVCTSIAVIATLGAWLPAPAAAKAIRARRSTRIALGVPKPGDITFAVAQVRIAKHSVKAPRIRSARKVFTSRAGGLAIEADAARWAALRRSTKVYVIVNRVAGADPALRNVNVVIARRRGGPRPRLRGNLALRVLNARPAVRSFWVRSVDRHGIADVYHSRNAIATALHNWSRYLGVLRIANAIAAAHHPVDVNGQFTARSAAKGARTVLWTAGAHLTSRTRELMRLIFGSVGDRPTFQAIKRSPIVATYIAKDLRNPVLARRWTRVVGQLPLAVPDRYSAAAKEEARFSHVGSPRISRHTVVIADADNGAAQAAQEMPRGATDHRGAGFPLTIGATGDGLGRTVSAFPDQISGMIDCGQSDPNGPGHGICNHFWPSWQLNAWAAIDRSFDEDFGALQKIYLLAVAARGSHFAKWTGCTGGLSGKMPNDEPAPFGLPVYHSTLCEVDVSRAVAGDAVPNTVVTPLFVRDEPPAKPAPAPAPPAPAPASTTTPTTTTTTTPASPSGAAGGSVSTASTSGSGSSSGSSGGSSSGSGSASSGTGSGATSPSGSSPFGSMSFYNAVSHPVGLAVADFGGAIGYDVAAVENKLPSQTNDSVEVFPGASNGTLGTAQRTTLDANADPSAIVTDDFDGDGKPDVAVSELGLSEVAVLIGDGNLGFVPGPIPQYGVGVNPVDVAAADFDSNGTPDLVTADATGTASVLLNQSGAHAGQMGTAAPFPAGGTSPNGVAAGDLNGDGKPDIVLADTGSDNVTVLRNTSTAGSGGPAGAAGTASFDTAQTVLSASGSIPLDVRIVDLNADGKPDVVVDNHGLNSVSVLLNQTAAGATTFAFAAPVTYSVGATGPTAIALGFFDSPTAPIDLATSNFGSANVSVLLGSGAGAFSSAVQQAAGERPQSAAAADLNIDSKDDLVVANSGARASDPGGEHAGTIGVALAK